jgi:hypothetical protein
LRIEQPVKLKFVGAIPYKIRLVELNYAPAESNHFEGAFTISSLEIHSGAVSIGRFLVEDE